MLRALGTAQQPVLAFAENLLPRPAPLPTHLPEGFEPTPPTSEAELDAVLAALRANASSWASTPPSRRAALLRACLHTTLAVSEEAAAAGTSAKGSWGQGIGEELLSWVPVVSGLRELAEALEAGGAPRPNCSLRSRDGQAIVDVFPAGLTSLLWGGCVGELWIEPGKEPSQGRLYREKAAGRSGTGAVGLVLGAGNQLPVAALDILHKLVVDDEVVVCKMNPVNEYLGPFLRRAFQPLVDAKLLEIVYGGGAVGSYLCNHPAVASVHLTGSAATYDAIVWQGKPKVGEPPFKKPVGAELGCVTPYIIVPGPWSDLELEYHADSVAAGLTNNAGHNCLKAELIITDGSWPLRERFLNALRRKLSSIPNRVAYYPGSDKKHAAFLARFPDAERLGRCTVAADGAQLSAGQQRAEMKPTPWLLKTGLSLDQAATQDENWFGCIQEVCLDSGGDPATFMQSATKWANDSCWGTLSCSVFVHPTTKRQHRAAYDAMLAGLKYGAIAVNVPSLLSFATTSLGWGAFPGGTPLDIGSGNVFVHNACMFDHKSVLIAPFVFHPKPAFWSPTHANLEAVARAALKFTAFPSLLSLLPLAQHALRG